MFGRHLGYFEIDKKAFEDLDIVKELLSQVIVIRADFHFDDLKMHYFAIGPFEKVDSGCIAPHYNIECDHRLDGRPLRFVKGDPLEAKTWLLEKKYDCLKCYDEGTLSCSNCNGSGEGMADGSHCLDCKGSGQISCSCGR